MKFARDEVFVDIPSANLREHLEVYHPVFALLPIEGKARPRSLQRARRMCRLQRIRWRRRYASGGSEDKRLM